MIREVAFLNFRGIKEGRLSLYPLTVLLGANNSGKTTVLEALYLLRPPDITYLSTYATARTGKKSMEEARVLSVAEVIHYYHSILRSRGFKFLVRNYKGEARIGCRLNGKFKGIAFKSELKGVRARGASISANAYEDIMTFVRKGLGAKTPGVLEPREEGVLLKDDGTTSRHEEPAGCLFIKPAILSLAFEFLKNSWYDIRSRGLTGKVARELSSLVSEDYDDLTLEPHIGPGLSLIVTLKGSKVGIRLSDLGDGMRVLAVTMLLWELLRADLLLWDDIEAFMNPSTLLYVADWVTSLVKGGAQAVVATHSLEAAKLLLREAEEADVEARAILLGLWDGELRHRVLTLDELERLKAAGVDVRVAGGFLL